MVTDVPNNASSATGRKKTTTAPILPIFREAETHTAADRVLGWLQHRRFKREAAAKGSTLEDVPGMLDAALRLAAAAAVATGVGLMVRVLLVQLLPGNDPTMILARAAVLCVVGISIYVALARRLGIGELAEIGGKLRRTLRLRQLT